MVSTTFLQTPYLSHHTHLRFRRRCHISHYPICAIFTHTLDCNMSIVSGNCTRYPWIHQKLTDDLPCRCAFRLDTPNCGWGVASGVMKNRTLHTKKSTASLVQCQNFTSRATKPTTPPVRFFTRHSSRAGLGVELLVVVAAFTANSNRNCTKFYQNPAEVGCRVIVSGC